MMSDRQADCGIYLTRVKEDKSVCADEVDTTSTSLATEQEDKLLAFRVVELVNHLLTLGNGHCAVKPEVPVSIHARMSNRRIRPSKTNVLLAPQ